MANGYHASIKNPDSSMFWELPETQEVVGTRKLPKAPFRHYLSHGCQLGLTYPSDDNRDAPMQKAQIWASTFDLGPMQLRSTPGIVGTD